MSIEEVKADILSTSGSFPFIRSVQWVDETDSAVKSRLFIEVSLFVQIYHNVETGTTNYVLIRNFSRVYGRDCCDGIWHTHPFEAPDEHDFSPEGSKSVSLWDFLCEVEEILLRENWL